MANVIYTAYFVDNTGQLLTDIPPLLPGEDIKLYAHHVTKAFKPEAGIADVSLGKRKILEVYAQVITEDIHAVLVRDPDGEVLSQNAYPHITIAARIGTPPHKSNEAITAAYAGQTVQLIEPVVKVPVTEGYFDGEKIYLN